MRLCRRIQGHNRMETVLVAELLMVEAEDSVGKEDIPTMEILRTSEELSRKFLASSAEIQSTSIQKSPCRHLCHNIKLLECFRVGKEDIPTMEIL